MNNVSPELEALAEFIIKTKWEDLPEKAIHDTKFLLLDSIGDALAALTTDQGKMTLALARRLGGPPESSIIGTTDKVSCSCASLANGELIRIVDYDATLPGLHAPPYVIPPPLAMAEITNASGKDLILATSLGFEIAARISNALPSLFEFEGPEAKLVESKRDGAAFENFGAAAGAGKLLNLNKDNMIHALAISGHLCQVLTVRKWFRSKNKAMTKYGVPGWQNTGAIMAVLLAEMGYIGDTTVFDAEQGFGIFCGYEEWHPERITQNLGKTWIFPRVTHKPFPCWRAFHTLLECFISLIEKNDLQPEDIESVHAFGDPHLEYPLFENTELKSIVDVQFGLPYVIALAAHRIKVGVEWDDWDTVTDPRIVDFAKKVSFEKHPDFGRQWQKHPANSLGKVEVIAKGKIFSEEKVLSRGIAGTDLEMTDEELGQKFKHNASRILTKHKIERAVKVLLDLENVNDVSALIKQITL